MVMTLKSTLSRPLLINSALMSFEISADRIAACKSAVTSDKYRRRVGRRALTLHLQRAFNNRHAIRFLLCLLGASCIHHRFSRLLQTLQQTRIFLFASLISSAQPMSMSIALTGLFFVRFATMNFNYSLRLSLVISYASYGEPYEWQKV